MSDPLLTFSATIPAPANFTGRVLVNMENGLAQGGYALRENEFTTTVEGFFECAKMAGAQIIYPDR